MADTAVQHVTHEAVQRLPGPAISYSPSDDPAASAGKLLRVLPVGNELGERSNPLIATMLSLWQTCCLLSLGLSLKSRLRHAVEWFCR